LAETLASQLLATAVRRLVRVTYEPCPPFAGGGWSGVVVERADGAAGWLTLSTLLGPEGTNAHLCPLPGSTSPCLREGLAGRGGWGFFRTIVSLFGLSLPCGGAGLAGVVVARHGLGDIPRVLRVLPRCCGVGVVGFGLVLLWWVVGWSLVENCIVDASILFFVVKLSRADGGCLGTRSR
jgi:hypothetical protein